MNKLKTYNDFLKENLEYSVGSDDSGEYDVYSGNPEWANNDLTRSVVDGYMHQIERATKIKVTSVEGEANESDSDLSFGLEDGNIIDVKYVYHPYKGKMSVTLRTSNYDRLGEKSYSEDSGSEYYGEDDVYRMVKDLYMENDLIEINYTHQITLPKELFSNDPYHAYDSDENDNHYVYFESEEAAQQWIKSLRIIEKR
jgi:hypothetical protein